MTKKMQPCRHLDYEEGKYGPDITLETCEPFFPDVKYWLRGPTWTDGGRNDPDKVQFCGQGRGRINGIFQCYNKGEMRCYDSKPTKGESK